MCALLLCLAASAQNNQPYRPQVHFSPKQNWTNDPNGLVYFEGEYHLFFQYNPFGDTWGHMSWGHAVSRDLVHWQELAVALPEEDGVMIFTGSTVVDENNTSGFCTGGKPCMVAVYTGHSPKLQTQNLAYSNDRGRTWTKYSGNPVLNLNLSDFRDPGVFWSAQAKRWIMAVALPLQHRVQFYGSADLRRWNLVSEFGPAGATSGDWECPSLFEAPVEGPRGGTRWVLKVGLNPGALQGGSGEQYFIGSFDGTRFVNQNPDSTTLWTDYGKDCYCALTFNGLPKSEKPVMLGWMNNWQYANQVPTSPWRGQMTIPRTVTLREYPEGLRLVQQPVLRRSGQLDLRNHAKVNAPYELRATVHLGAAEEVGWKLFGSAGQATIVGYDVKRQELFVDRTHSGVVDFSGQFPARTVARLEARGSLEVDIVVDRSSVEVFAQQGRVAMTNLVFPLAGSSGVEFYSRGGKAVATWKLESIGR
ncbi:MAG: glycoside hydrolase family 32 protein [Acidobacteriota bacterium]|nr:glycoside hydrolase family 32 protein [Acidobacteriota bacterium]